jgi:hypothetical protein
VQNSASQRCYSANGMGWFEQKPKKSIEIQFLKSFELKSVLADFAGKPASISLTVCCYKNKNGLKMQSIEWLLAPI